MNINAPSTKRPQPDPEQEFDFATREAAANTEELKESTTEEARVGQGEQIGGTQTEGEEQSSIDKSRFVTSDLELFAGIGFLVAWFTLFASGILIASSSLIEGFSEVQTLWGRLGYVLLIAMSWTITNVGLLSCLSAAMGAYGRRTRFTSRWSSYREVYQLRHQRERAAERELARIHYASAIMRGFAVYALALAGLLVLVTDSLLSPGQAEYVRLAATISVVSFYAGYDPEMFAGVLERIRRFMKDSG